MNHLYIYDGPFERGENGWGLIREAASRYGSELGLPYDFINGAMERTEKGKPFFVDIPVAFSLSHSGAMWMCMFSDGPCGLDLQVVEPDRDWQSICRRICTPEEQHYVDLWGVEGFYQIWAYKEAFGKCTGGGIFSEMPPMVDEGADLIKTVDYDGVTYSFEEVAILPEVKCVYCVAGQAAEAELRILG